MTDKQAVLAIESRAYAEQLENGWWIVRRSPAGEVLGYAAKPSRAWREVRMRLFNESIGKIISEIPTAGK
jgi:hypothetical protein